MNKVKLYMLDRQSKILADMLKGVSSDKIAAKWGITRARVYQILHEAGWSARTIAHAEQQFPTLAEVDAVKEEAVDE